jgi:alkanesulfonate monooxygenase SsuD/methylene tetrahydromethanopterin reductase-like flavin-dependent oxidoreductase (luciferase family)
VAARDPNSHDFAVSQGCNVQVTPLHLGDEEVVSLMERFNAACAAHPQVPRPKIMVLRHAYVADSEADAQQAADEINAFYCYFGAWFKNERPITPGPDPGADARWKSPRIRSIPPPPCARTRSSASPTR